jgi:hypothetical protein
MVPDFLNSGERRLVGPHGVLPERASAGQAVIGTIASERAVSRVCRPGKSGHVYIGARDVVNHRIFRFKQGQRMVCLRQLMTVDITTMRLGFFSIVMGWSGPGVLMGLSSMMLVPSELWCGYSQRYAAMLGRAAMDAYQCCDATCASGIGRFTALVANSTVTIAVMSATLKRSPATKGASVSLSSRSA